MAKMWFSPWQYPKRRVKRGEEKRITNDIEKALIFFKDCIPWSEPNMFWKRQRRKGKEIRKRGGEKKEEG